MAVHNTRSSAARVPPGALRGLFVTGTDTGVGKTAVGAALARLLGEHGAAVKVRKPIESGCRHEAGRLLPADAQRLREAARGDEPLESICRYPLEAALSPERAARLAGVTVTRADLERACREGVGAGDFLLVEAAGGWFTPLAPDALVADLAADLGLPVLLVAADRLGCLNHALLSSEAIVARGLTLAAVVLNRVQPDHPADMDNAADLCARLTCDVVELPYTAELGAPWEAWRAALEPLARRLLASGL